MTNELGVLDSTKPVDSLITGSVHISKELDSGWLSQFDIEYDDQVGEYLQNLVNADSEDLKVDQDHYQQAIITRDQFFELIGMPGIDSDMAIEKTASNPRIIREETRPTIMPIHTVIQTFRQLNINQINVSEAINKHPQILNYAPESVQDKVNNLNALGIKASEVINKNPAILGYAPKSVQDKVNNLTTLGIKASDVINKHPPILGLSPKSVQDKVNNLTTLGIKASDVINKFPPILNYAPESVQDKVNNLTTIGIKASDVINKRPSILGYASESVQDKVNNLNALGIKASDVINKFPPILGYAKHKINLTVYSLMKAGLWEDKIHSSGKIDLGIKSMVNDGNADVFILPIQSLITYLHDSKSPSPKSLASNAKKYMKQLGNTTASNRKEYVHKILESPETRRRLGYIATLYSMVENIVDDYQW